MTQYAGDPSAFALADTHERAVRHRPASRLPSQHGLNSGRARGLARHHGPRHPFAREWLDIPRRIADHEQSLSLDAPATREVRRAPPARATEIIVRQPRLREDRRA